MQWKTEGDVVHTIEGNHRFEINTVRLHGYSGVFLEGPRKGDDIYMSYSAFIEHEEDF